ncbi:hypothetical protein G7054_g7552 [Neopestalotiopsis clavispora]|nr:hypothetical protein G7054_g7552 [Neopestalotiopsis clavispora]
MSSPLIAAARRGHVDTVRKLIENQYDVNVVDDSGRTPLSWAAHEGHSEVARELLAWPITVHNIQDDKNRSPMDLALINGHVEVLRVLLHNDTVMAEAIENKTRLVYLAAQYGHAEAMKLLMDQLAVNINSQDDHGHSLLSVAVSIGSNDIVRLLLQSPGIDVNLRDNGGRCPLSHAISPDECRAKSNVTGRYDVAPSELVQAMVSRPDIDPNSIDDEGHSPFSRAVASGNWGLVEAILSHSKTQINEHNSDRTISLRDLARIMTRSHDWPFLKSEVRYAKEAFQYFMRHELFQVDWTQEDASATLLDLVEHKGLGYTHLELLLERFPLNIPGHIRLFDSLLALSLKIQDDDVTRTILKHSTLVPNLSSDEWLSRIEAVFQRIYPPSYSFIVSELIDRDTTFPKCRNERMDNVIGTMLILAARVTLGEKSVNSLSRREHVDFNYRDRNNCTVLWHAADSGHLNNIEQLLQIDTIEVDHEDDTYHDSPVARLLKFSEGLKLELRKAQGNRGSSSEYKKGLARDIGRALKLSELLLRKSTTHRNGILLIQAAMLGQEDTVRLLLGLAKIDPNQRDDNSATPLIRASMNGHKSIVKLLLGDSRVIPSLENKFQQTALHAALLRHHSDIASLLVNRDNVTWTRFCNNGLVNEIKLLYEVGLPLNARDPRGRTPLHLACLTGDVRMIQELIKAGLDVNLEDNYGETPLRLAIRNRHIDTVKALVGGSADMKGITRDDWLATSYAYSMVTVLEISKNARGERALHFNDASDPTNWDTITDTCHLKSFHNQLVFMSKIPPTLKAAFVNYPRRAIVTGVVHDEVAQFGASLDVPFTRDEPIAPELTVSWHKTRVAWKMHNTISQGQPAWETVGYASSLPCGWIPDSASDFLAIFILDAVQGWILFLDHADEYLAHQRSRQIDERGMSPALIDGLAKDAQIWARLRTRHKFQVDSFKREYDTFCRNYRQADYKEATMRAIDEFSSKIADRLAKLDQTTRDLLQLEFAWVSIREAHLSTSLATSMKRLSWITFIFLPMTFASSLFGMNVDILENNPNWRWFLPFAGGALVITVLVWLISKYSNIETLLERHLGKRLQRLSDPTARKAASSHSL